MDGSPADLGPLEQRLSALLDNIRDADTEQPWRDVENVSQALANGLRIRDGPVDNHSILGKTALPWTVTSLFTLALKGSPFPGENFTSVVFELLRVAANLCMDHDENRGRLLEAELPQALVSLLEGYAESIPPPPYTKPLSISVPHLKVIRTAIGVLLNASIGYDAVKSRLNSLEAAMTLLKLSTAIYPPGSWYSGLSNNEDIDGAASEEVWALRSGISNWAWRTISELKDVKDDSLRIFTPDALPLLVLPLRAFCPPYPPKTGALFDTDSSFASSFIETDFDVLEESSTLIESLSLDVEDIRLSLARGLHFPAEHAGIPCLSSILDFIEYGTYPPWWDTTAFDDAERKRKKKAFDICKAALIKSVVEVAGEESNEDVLWDDSESEKPGGIFVYRMVNWLQRYVEEIGGAAPGPEPEAQSFVDRDDMAICASLALGNLARREKNSAALLAPPYSLAPVLTSAHLLSPSTDIKVKHGVLGLLKHLAQAPAQSYAIHAALSKADVIRRIAASGVWDEKTDAMADVVQLSAIGVVKHMCNVNVENTYALVIPSSRHPDLPTGLAQILALVKRSDSVPIKSEGSRVLVNVVKSLWSINLLAKDNTDSPESPVAIGNVNKEELLERHRKRNVAIRTILTPECAWTLASLVGRSGKYPLLINEGVVALSLLSTNKEGGPLVLAAILTPLSSDAPMLPDPVSASTSSDLDSPVATTHSDRPHLHIPRHALDMLVFVLKNVDNPANYPVEVRINVCSLLLQLGKHTSGDELNKVKLAARPVLESLIESAAGAQGKEEILEKTMKRVLDTWS
ncbi:hypothetical protein Hypma_011561 [Hypsizygus marmoreus]|uniref:Uncharacterized protein n=1 Tax=Hypsizygus marmoreus TaxID=39966 RepID=A0A369JGM8_HYPMA|nr:hypothetical protein Hypma_011561 [Hypsizygus marmoreus]